VFLRERNWWREPDDLNEVILKGREIRVAFLEGKRAQRETNRDVVASMGFWLRCLKYVLATELEE